MKTFVNYKKRIIKHIGQIYFFIGYLKIFMVAGNLLWFHEVLLIKLVFVSDISLTKWKISQVS